MQMHVQRGKSLHSFRIQMHVQRSAVGRPRTPQGEKAEKKPDGMTRPRPPGPETVWGFVVEHRDFDVTKREAPIVRGL
jgi:hypothetical protein